MPVATSWISSAAVKCFLLAEPERVDERSHVDGRSLVGIKRESADRLAVLDQLLGDVLPVEVRPPDRPILTAVVLQELRHQPVPALLVARLRKVFGKAASQRCLQSSDLVEDLLRLLGGLARRRRRSPGIVTANVVCPSSRRSSNQRWSLTVDRQSTSL